MNAGELIVTGSAAEGVLVVEPLPLPMIETTDDGVLRKQKAQPGPWITPVENRGRGPLDPSDDSWRQMSGRITGYMIFAHDLRPK